jgi:hypothetical protein
VETLVALCVGLGLSAACGFRVFIPMLAMSLAGKAGLLGLGPGFEWMATWPALVGFGTAACVEVVAYYIPWLDHLLDTIASPAAVLAGTLAAASQIDSMHPMLQWSTALIGGGGAAGGMQLLTVGTRVTSTVTTAGIANPIVSSIENAVAAILSALAIIVPVALGVVLLIIVAVLVRRRIKRSHQRARAATLTPA